MKKNKMMRIASVLLVAVLISTCAISGTFAKYITKASGEDQARVAKWGILLTLKADELFASEYEADDDTYVGTGDWEGITVKADTEEAIQNLVAPGTYMEDAIVATVKGTPEVATRYSLIIDTTKVKDVILPAGEYTDYTELVKNDDGEYGYFNTFTLDKDYTPVKWDISVKKGNTKLTLSEVASDPKYASIMQSFGYSADGFSLTDIQEIVTGDFQDALLALLTSVVNNASNPQVTEDADGNVIISLDFDPNKVMDFTFTLSWKWAFDAETSAYANDKADTYLGNVAAKALLDTDVQNIADANAEISTDLAAFVTATAVQID